MHMYTVRWKQLDIHIHTIGCHGTYCLTTPKYEYVSWTWTLLPKVVQSPSLVGLLSNTAYLSPPQSKINNFVSFFF